MIKPIMKKRKSPKRKQSRRRVRPDTARMFEDDAELLMQRGMFLQALRLLDSSIESGNVSFRTWKLTGQGLLALGEYAQALGALQHAVDLAGTDPESRFLLGEAHFQLGNVSTAVDHFEAVARKHDHLNSWCNLATIIPGDPRACPQRIKGIRTTFAKRLAASDKARSALPVPSRRTTDRYRIGYISSFFANVNYMKPVSELIRRHDRSRFEIHLFSDGSDTQEVEWAGSSTDVFHETQSLSNHQLVEQIRQQRLDVLIDLNGYSIPHRLTIYTHRLAKNVVAWFNMYATSGLPGIDWIIGDRFVAPLDEDSDFSERVIRLPQSYLSFEVNYDTPPVATPPCLETGQVTLGSLVSQYKITPEVYDAWSKILHSCKSTQIVIANRAMGSACNRDHVRQQFVDRSIRPERIICLPPAKHEQFLQYYDQIDIALDAFPYNGGTTTTEAIWQGVPTLAIRGDRWASRTSGTLLNHCHLQDFVTDSVSEYIRTAIKICKMPDVEHYLSSMRESMRDRLLRSAVCNTATMVESFENAIIEIMVSS